MAYSNKITAEPNGFITRIKIKFGKKLAKKFPLNRIRTAGLRLCGFQVGKQVYIGEDLIVASIISNKSCNLEIQDRVAIAPRVTLVLSSDANWSNLMDDIDPVAGTIVLEEDCWLGTGVIVHPNITIGKRAIVASGAVVTKDVPPNTVVAGVPARFLKNVT
jgi:acetyltransferase-like isoleucine patch superfamily enzyme